MTAEAVLVPTRPPGLLEVREGLPRDRIVNLSTSLVNAGNYAEARAFMPDQMTLAKRVLGSDHLMTLNFQWGYFRAFFLDEDVTAEQLVEPAAALKKAIKIAQRVLGPEHPATCNYRRALELAKLPREIYKGLGK